MPSYDERNEDIVSNCYEAEGRLRRAWAYGHAQAYERLRRFAEWFEDIWLEIDDLTDDSQLSDRAERAALLACEELLCYDHIPCEDYLKYIVRIRCCLRPDEEWDDYPYDVTGLEESSEESSDDGMMFHMEI
ncbi:uncharacterized protein I303_104632 [Kwoniella dejecticola CBS 10117]|uniref:Uncharacterized protein n=1 Tax=Kwoniella dejecticola CBS 10117 TaxID=1296121 RepID=A0A1A6A4S1_9TREE|nr:uncharacterized protein I303_04388 [Kwoniella dejecticola CBS 10117]OBR85059.1 hypothetical protein I303_04388 [Kwoniella dejecticola CBS 10117]